MSCVPVGESACPEELGHTLNSAGFSTSRRLSQRSQPHAHMTLNPWLFTHGSAFIVCVCVCRSLSLSRSLTLSLSLCVSLKGNSVTTMYNLGYFHANETFVIYNVESGGCNW